MLQTNMKKSKPLELTLNIDDTLNILQKAMEVDQLYKNPMLRLEHLVKHTGIPQKTVSSILNQTLNKSFNEKEGMCNWNM